MHPPLPGGDLPEQVRRPVSLQLQPGRGRGSGGAKAVGSRHVGQRRTGVPGFGSEGQRLHKDLVDDGRRGHQVLQLEVEDALQALGAQGP